MRVLYKLLEKTNLHKGQLIKKWYEWKHIVPRPLFCTGLIVFALRKSHRALRKHRKSSNKTFTDIQ